MNRRIKKKKTHGTTVAYRGLTLVQSTYNNHYMIFDNNDKMVMHCQYTEKLTRQQAKRHIDLYFKFCEIDWSDKND